MVAPDRDAQSLRHHPGLVGFWLANASSGFGFQMLSVAAAWQIYATTGRALDLGLIGLVQFVPSLLLALPAGHLADQLDRRRIVLWTIGLEGVAALGLIVLTLTDHAHSLGVLGLLFMISVGKAFEFPARNSMLPAMVPAAVLPRALSVNASGRQAAMIVGPALGGFLYIAGPSVVYGASGLLYLLSGVLMATLTYRQARSPRAPATLQSVFAGVQFIRKRPDLLGIISLDLFAVLFGGATALLPIFARDVLHTGPWGLGLLRAAPAVGALLMSLWLARRESLRRRIGAVMFAAVAGFGVMTLVFALSTRLWLSLAALVLLGAFDMISMVIRGSLVQLDTPDDMRGRVTAVNAIFINTSNQLGEFESGLLAAWVGAVSATVVGGVGTLAVVGLWMLLFPTLRRRQRLHADPAPGEP